MKRRLHPLPRASSAVLTVAIVVLMLAIFVADTVTELEVAVAVFYVAVVLVAVGAFQRRGVILVSAACMVLTILSYVLTPSGAPQPGLINGLISLSAIAVTAYLALRIASAEVAMHAARTQLAHMARVTTLGELAASIAHEVNQPLAAMATSGNACLRWLAQEPPQVEKARQAADRIVADAHRASDIIDRIRRLARPSAPRKEWLNLNETVQEILALTHSEIASHDIVLRTAFADDLPPVLMDRIQVQQVVLNLVMNAIEAMSVPGDQPRELVITSAMDGSKAVQVSVRDSGVGLDPAALDRLFDAFYTTKKDGMGMGLAISRSIVEDHGGRVWATAQAGGGVTVAFTLPTSRAEVS